MAELVHQCLGRHVVVHQGDLELKDGMPYIHVSKVMIMSTLSNVGWIKHVLAHANLGVIVMFTFIFKSSLQFSTINALIF